MPRSLHLIAPRLSRPWGPVYRQICALEEAASAESCAVSVYVSQSFDPSDHEPGPNYVPYFSDARAVRTAGGRQKGDAPETPARKRTFASPFLALMRSYHVRDGLRALVYLSFPPRSREFVDISYEATRHTYRFFRAIFGLIRRLPMFIVDLPRAAHRIVAGPRVSLDPFSPFATELAGLRREKNPDGTAGNIVVTDDLSFLDALIDCPLLLDTWTGEIAFALAVDNWSKVSLDQTIDAGRLGDRLATSGMSDRISIYAADDACRSHLEALLDRPVHSLDELVSLPPSDPRSSTMVTKPLAAVVRPQWLFCGSNMVFANQIDYLVERGYYVLEIVVNDLFLGDSTPEALTRYVLNHNRGSRAHRTLVLNMKVGLWPWMRILMREGRAFFHSSIAMRAMCLQLVEVPEQLVRVVAAHKPSIVVVNHCFNMKAARQIFGDVPFVLESHDIQAKQSRLRSSLAGGAEGEFNMDSAVADELTLMSDADWVVSLNDEETKFFLESDGIKGVTTIHPFLAAPRGLTPNGKKVTALAPHVLAAEKPIRLDPIDVLLVASPHAANIVSIRWFLDEVFKPHLGGREIGVTIVGGISDNVSDIHPRLRYTGQVDDIAPYYNAARVVALPVTSGAGIPIKTLEALALGKAVVATTAAMRGLSYNGGNVLSTQDEPGAFADEIVRLLADPSQRAARARDGLALAERNYSRDEYFRRWDTIIDTVSATANH